MTMQEKEKELKAGIYAIKLIGAVLNGECPPAAPQNLDWYALKSVTEKHCISNIAAYAIGKISEPVPDDIKSYYSEIILQSLAKEAQTDVEITLLASAFGNAEIPYMILKGYVIKHLYPQPNMRSMGDVDILVGENIDKAQEVMNKCGFSLKGRENLHDHYIKKPALNIELHRSLVDEELTEMYSYFGVGFDRARLAEDSQYGYELSKEDFYIFLIAHMAKHFKRCGTGIRSVADVWVYNQAYGKSLNREYLNAEFEKLGLLKFCQTIEKLSDEWFSKNADFSLDSVGEYIVFSGVYGNIHNLELNRFLQAEASDGSYSANKLKYVLKNIFPGLKYMSARYKTIKKHKFLLPIFWVIRIFSTLFKSRKNISYRLKGVTQSDESDIKKFKDSGLG